MASNNSRDEIFNFISKQEINRYLGETKVELLEEIKFVANGPSVAISNSTASNSDDRSFDNSYKAKIIPLHDKIKLPIDSIEPSLAGEEEVVARKENLESIGVLSANKVKAIEQEREDNLRRSSDSATVFLLKERQKLKSSKKRLIEQQAYRVYKEAINQEFHDVSSEDEDSLDLKGILINKKHY